MKEQIIAIIGKNIKCIDEWGSLTGFNECADEIMILFAEAMPTEEEIVERAKERYDYLEQLGYPLQVLVKYKDAIIETGKWFRNRMGGEK